MLNDEQQQAVDHGGGPLLVVAGPGSGKTRTATHRCAELLRRGVPPERILLVTFTNRAAGEMRVRMVELASVEQVRKVWAGTFHSLCSRMLRRVLSDPYLADRQRNFTVYDEKDQRSVVKVVIQAMELDPKTYSPDKAIEWIARQKSKAKHPDDFAPESPLEETSIEIWRGYEKSMVASNAFDFEDLLVKVMLAAESSTSDGQRIRSMFEHVVVDEYQDTDPIQRRLIKAWASGGNICAVGDPRQAIYGFRGADYRNIIQFPEDFEGAEVVTLTRCYRSSPQIVDTFNAMIAGNALVDNDELPLQIEHRMVPESSSGVPVRVYAFGADYGEAISVCRQIEGVLGEGTRRSQCAIIYRLHSLSRPFEAELRNAAIPYVLVGGTGFYERREVKDALSLCKLVDNLSSSADMRRALDRYPGVGPKAVQEFEQNGRAHGSMWEGMVHAVGESQRLTTPQRKASAAFVEIIRSARSMAARSARPSEVAQWLIDRSGLRSVYAKEVEKAVKKGGQKEIEKAETRLLNLDQVVSAALSYEQRASSPSLSGWLDEVSLMSKQDDLGDSDRVALLTIHAAKGLEFEHVWFVGVEDELMPFWRAVEEGGADEEQRLAYVACSRAKKTLSLSYCTVRMMYGQTKEHGPSPLLVRAAQELSDEASIDWPDDA